MEKFQDDGVLSNVLAGLPRVAEVIATVPEEKRERALEAAEECYLNTARELGYGEADAQQWAAAVMLRLRAEADEGHVEEADSLA
jgi:hypothetical protein